MERTLLAVERDEFGWQVLVRGKPIEAHASKAAAIDAAADFARLRHDATGEPTGVKVQMSYDETVLINVYG